MSRAVAAVCLLALLTSARCNINGLHEVPTPGRHDTVLIVAPHIDDDMIAAGGYAIDAVNAGAQVYVVYVTSGDSNRTTTAMSRWTIDPHSDDYLSQGRTRIKEAKVALSLFGVPESHAFFLGYPDRKLAAMMKYRDRVFAGRGTREVSVPYSEALSPGAEYSFPNLWRDFAEVLQNVKPTIVVAPVDFDAHPDHRAAGILAREEVAAWNSSVPILGYLVHAADFPQPFHPKRDGFLVPSAQLLKYDWSAYVLDEGTEKKKAEVLRAYRSQRRDPYLLLLIDSFVRRNELFIEERLD